jgi:hypothetical protein
MTAPQIIEALGGTAKVAQLCGLSYNAVHNWRSRGIPRAWMHKVEAECRRAKVSVGEK